MNYSYCSDVIPDNTMEGAVQSITILFKDQHGENSDEDRRLLEVNLDDIVYATGYIAGYYITKRQNYLMENDTHVRRYYKIRITSRAYFMKPTAAVEGIDTYKVFDNERMINRFNPRAFLGVLPLLYKPIKWQQEHAGGRFRHENITIWIQLP